MKTPAPTLLATSLLAMALSAQAQTSLSTAANPSPLGIGLLTGPNLSISDLNNDAAAPSAVQTTSAAFQQFNADLGVLTGVRGSLTVSPGQSLFSTRGEGGGDYDAIATVTSFWSVGTSPNQAILANSFSIPGQPYLAQAISNRDTPSNSTSIWNSLSFSQVSTPDAFVGTGLVTTNVQTSLSALIGPRAGGGSMAIASILTGPSPNQLYGTASLSYDYLLHSNGSFDGASDLNALSLHLDSSSPGAFALHALGNDNTVNLAVGSWTCSGDCSAFEVNWDGSSPAAIAAGAHAGGAASFLGGSGSFRAVYTLAVGDAEGLGGTQRSGALSLELTAGPVAAVPEPESWALTLAGLLAVGSIARRRRAV